tara:strand:+ start:5678 stop:6340 length:663 start_codon:yes stop_codon:yes gene_type:complete
MKISIITLILMFGLVVGLVYADGGKIETYKPNEEFYLSIYLSNLSKEINFSNCNIQIRNDSYGVILDDNYTNMGYGWYNYSYKANKTGLHFCRYNCTYDASFTADTCTFNIEGDENLGITIALIILGVAAIFLVLSFAISSKQHMAIKLLFLIVAMIVMLIGLNFAYIDSIDNGASKAVQSLLSTLYRVGIYAFILFIGYIVVYYIYVVFKHFKQYSNKT